MPVLGQTLVKLAISRDRLRVAQSRQGRRPMSVTTFLRKEQDGTLYKAPEHAAAQVQELSKTIGLNTRNLFRRKRVGEEIIGKVRKELRDALPLKLGSATADYLPGGKADESQPTDFPPAALSKGIKTELEHTDDRNLAKEIAMDHLKEHPEYYTALKKMEAGLEEKQAEVGPWENKLPWYTTAGLGAVGGAAGHSLAPQKYKTLGMLGGTLLGTGVGLEGGTPIGRKLDSLRKKTAGSDQAMQHMYGEGSSRGLQSYIEQEDDHGRPATARVKQGDSPSRDDHPAYGVARSEANPGMRSLDLAMKVALVMTRLVGKDQFPTLEDQPTRDPAVALSRSQAGYQHASDTPTTEWNPDGKSL